MSSKTDSTGVTAVVCWAVAALGAALAGVLIYLYADIGISGAVFMAFILFLIVGFVLHWGMLSPLPAPGETKIDAPDISGTVQSTTLAAATPITSEPIAAEPAPTVDMTPPAAAPVPEPEPEPEPAPAAEPAPVAEPVAAAEPEPEPEAPSEPAAEDPGVKPEGLAAAREGGPDDLKQIKGIGPKLEAMLHGMGYFHFDQVAAWTGQEVAWVDQNLEGFKGRVTRDQWVTQAHTLASGGTTEFSKKVDKGDVY
ncbi:MAG: NADH:ubiquinone oxidoreductase [Pseudomonadota bacterium]